MWIHRSLFLSLAARLCFSQTDFYLLAVFELIEKSLARNFLFIDKDGSGCVSVLEAQEVIFGKWLLGWNITDISHFCSSTGDNVGHKSCDEYYNSVMKTDNYTRSASSPWNVLMAASMRASGERMITDCLFAGLHFNTPDWDECLQQEDIMKFIEEALEKIGESSMFFFHNLLIDPGGPGSQRAVALKTRILHTLMGVGAVKPDISKGPSDEHVLSRAVLSTAGSLLCCVSLCFGVWLWRRAKAARNRQEDIPNTMGGAATDLWGPEGRVSVSVVDPSILAVADLSVGSCSEGAFQSSDLVHIMAIGIVEHWFIKPLDITPDPNSILGRGAFGIVVKGVLHCATEVAIKIPKTRFQSPEESQLANEMMFFRHIRHSNVVLFHGATLMSLNGGSPILSLVLEWVNGGNFGEYMQQFRSTGVFEADGRAFAYKILLDVARGMTYLHKLTPIILHLDLKPANILVEKSVPPIGKITDFGLSRFALNSLPQHKVGTEKYMAPEVALRKPYGPAADVFSFGRVIIWTITGKLGNGDLQILVKEEAFFFQTLDEVASSCLEEEPHMRPNFVQVYEVPSETAYRSLLTSPVHEAANGGMPTTPMTGGQTAVVRGAKVPKYDGKTALRKFFRKVALCDMNTNTPHSKRAGKLIEEFTDAAWDSEIGCELPPLVKAYFFLQKAKLDHDTRRSVLVGAGSYNEHERLRASVCSLVLKNSSPGPREPEPGPRGRFRRFQKAKGVRLTKDDAAGGDVAGGDAGSSGEGTTPSGLAKLEAEAQVLATQAKAKRAEVDKARGWSKSNNPDRLRELKSKLPCTRCKSAGKLVYGHCKDDEECPERRKESHGTHVTMLTNVSSAPARTGSILTEAVLVMALGAREKLCHADWARDSHGAGALGNESMRTLGAVIDLDEELIFFKRLKKMFDLKEISAGHVCFDLVGTTSSTDVAKDLEEYQGQGRPMSGAGRVSVAQEPDWSNDKVCSAEVVCYTTCDSAVGAAAQLVHVAGLEANDDSEEERDSDQSSVTSLSMSTHFSKATTVRQVMFLGEIDGQMQLLGCLPCGHSGSRRRRVRLRLPTRPSCSMETSKAATARTTGVKPKSLYEMRKDELITALVDESEGGVSPQEAATMRVPRLRLLLKALRPSKHRGNLPTGFKQWKKDLLVELAMSCVPNLQEDEAASMGREEIILRLEQWDAGECEENREETPSTSGPKCRDCALAMIRKQNRATQDFFWGCVRFPLCRVTLPLVINHMPTEVAQEAWRRQREAKAKLQAKAKAACTKATDSASSSASGSWRRVRVPSLDGDEMTEPDESNTRDKILGGYLKRKAMKSGVAKLASSLHVAVRLLYNLRNIPSWNFASKFSRFKQHIAMTLYLNSLCDEETESKIPPGGIQFDLPVGRFELIEKSLARNFPFIDKDGSGCVSVLEAQEVIFGKWLLGWNITDISHLCSPTGDNGGHKSCDGYYNSVMKTDNYTRSASSPWHVLMAASMRASGGRMITDCLFAGLHFNKPDWDECLQQEDIMKFIEEVPEGSCIKDQDFAYAYGSRQLALLRLALLWSLALAQSQSCEDLWGPEGRVSVSVVDPSILAVADLSVGSCSEGAFQSSDLVHIMTIGIVEHWFIKRSDITPDPNSILGSGAFGIVVKGVLHCATEVAIKIPKMRFQSPEESQLANEMMLFRHIRHSNVVLFHGATLMSLNGGSPILSLVLEWVNGGNFGEYMQQFRSNGVFE
ncbi:unnamed protein product, partial [Polarella glacialis]